MKATILMLALAAAGATPAVAGAISGLCNTGVVSGCASQTPMGANKADGNFTVTLSPVGTTPFAAHTIPSNPGYYTSGGNSIGTSTASWITTDVGTPPTETNAYGTFNYQEAITSNVNGVVTFSGSYGADNCATVAWGSTPVAVSGSGVTLGGGVANCQNNMGTFTGLTSFSFQETVVAGGTYYLDFEVGNVGYQTGLLVDCLSASGGTAPAAAPEPSSILMSLTGFGLLGARSGAGD